MSQSTEPWIYIYVVDGKVVAVLDVSLVEDEEKFDRSLYTIGANYQLNPEDYVVHYYTRDEYIKIFGEEPEQS